MHGNKNTGPRTESKFVPLDKVQRKWISPPKPPRSRYQSPEGKRPWLRLFLDVLEHDAYRVLSINARRAYDALVCHLHRDTKSENGSLTLSYKAFEAFGVTHTYIASAVRELEQAGLISCSCEPQKHPLLPAAKRYGVTAYDDRKRAFAWVYADVLESPAWRGLSINGRRVLDRLLIENTRHRYKANGSLRVSTRQFAGRDNGRRHVMGAIRELQTAGLLDITKGKANGKFAAANLYRLTFLGTLDGPATWRPETTLEKKTEMPAKKTFPTPQKGSTSALAKNAAPSKKRQKKPPALPHKRGPSITSSRDTLGSEPALRRCNGATKHSENHVQKAQKERSAIFCAEKPLRALSEEATRLVRKVLWNLRPDSALDAAEIERISATATRNFVPAPF